ncbi:MAG TPA: crotonobetainyl-CoA--carnitine CoA-transferase [Jatrophihabitans sp.]|jgi:hypothetical protein|nr:crotonobetainyl-CoA--carnitine CoA-transferase [Jatrophihabitans sp.]
MSSPAASNLSTNLSTDLIAAAQRCRDREVRGAGWPPVDVARLAELTVRVDERFCREVADRYERAPRLAYDGALEARYDQVKQECRRQYEDVLEAGITVEPWLSPGPPYRDSTELVRLVRETRTIRVLLTRDEHGPPGRAGFHPLREPSGVTAAGMDLLYNDLLRTVHDLFGHVMFAAGFGLAGELKAAYCHLALHSEDARAVLFNEQVAQICWFYFGPHLRDDAGRLRGPGEQGYLPPRARPYPEQKVFPPDSAELEAFRRMFSLRQAS